MSDRDFELAAQRAEQERDAGVLRITMTMQELGAPWCRRCGEAIPMARREAMPSATDCIECRQETEKAR